MGVVVLIVGALLLVAGSYEMVAGSSDILSERGWSAFIAGSVLLSGGVVTMAVGVAVRVLESLGAAIRTVRPQGQLAQGQLAQAQFGLDQAAHGEPALGERALGDGAFGVRPQGDSPLEDRAREERALENTASHRRSLKDRLLGGRLSGNAAAPADRTEPEPRFASAAPIAPAMAELDPLHEPTFEHSASFEHPATFEHAPTAPVLAAAAIEHDRSNESPREVSASPRGGTDHEPAATAEHEPLHDEWLDRSSADLDHEAPPTTTHHNEAAAEHGDLLAARDEPASGYEPDHGGYDYERHAAPDAEHKQTEAHAAEAGRETTLHYDLEPEEAAPDHATVSAREELAPSTSAVIGRYESEGTSYVMYADGSIDASSAAGVYRFASMAELKAFIES